MKNPITIIAAALLLLCSGLLTQTALAHSSVAQSNPADGSTLSTPPETLEMAFDQPVRLTLVTLTRDAEGLLSFMKSGTEVPLSVNAGGMNAEFKINLPELTNGAYTVEWRALAQDGHAMSGHMHFTVADE